MLGVILFFITFVPKGSLTWPISPWSDTALAYDLTSDYMDYSFYGPWSLDYLRGNRLMGTPGVRTAWPFDRYGGPFSGGDTMDPFNPTTFGPDLLSRPMDYLYNLAYPKTTEVAKENYVRDYPYGGTEVGMRDSVSMRNGPSPWRSGMSRSYPYYPQPPSLTRGGFRGLERFYNPFFSDDFPTYPLRRPIPFGMSAARPSSLRWGGDLTYLRR